MTKSELSENGKKQNVNEGIDESINELEEPKKQKVGKVVKAICKAFLVLTVIVNSICLGYSHYSMAHATQDIAEVFFGLHIGCFIVSIIAGAVFAMFIREDIPLAKILNCNLLAISAAVGLMYLISSEYGLWAIPSGIVCISAVIASCCYYAQYHKIKKGYRSDDPAEFTSTLAKYGVDGDL